MPTLHGGWPNSSASSRPTLQAENCQPIRYSGEFYTVDVDIPAPTFGRLHVPILIGEFNKGMV